MSNCWVIYNKAPIDSLAPTGKAVKLNALLIGEKEFGLLNTTWRQCFNCAFLRARFQVNVLMASVGAMRSCSEARAFNHDVNTINVSLRG